MTVGDKVKFVKTEAPSYEEFIGEEGTITEIDKEIYFVCFNHQENPHHTCFGWACFETELELLITEVKK
jgi:hypothetical protein